MYWLIQVLSDQHERRAVSQGRKRSTVLHAQDRKPDLAYEIFSAYLPRYEALTSAVGTSRQVARHEASS